MADVQISLQLTGVQAADAELAKLNTTFTDTAGRVRNADGTFVKMGESAAKLGGAFAATDSPLAAFSTKLATLSKSVAAFGAKASLIAAPFALAGKSLISSGADFERAMNRIKVVSGATVGQMAQVAEAAKRIGATTTFSAGEAADALIQLSKNGISLQDALGGVLDATVNLAAATGTNLGDAADIAAKAMQQFGAQAKDLPLMMDQLFNSTQQSTFELGDMAGALAQAGGVAASAGLSFGETNTALVTMSPLFSTGTDAGTSFKQMLVTLAAPSKQAAEMAKALGINVRDAHGAFLPMRDIVEQLSKSFGPLASAQKVQAASTLVGTDAMRAILALAKGGVAVWDANSAAVNKAGTTAAAAAAMMKGFWGAMDQVTGAIELVGIALVKSGFIPWLGEMAIKLANFITTLSEANPALLNWGAGLTLALVAIGPIALAVSGLTGAVAALTAGVLGLAGAFKVLNTVILANPFARMALLAVAAYDSINKATDQFLADQRKQFSDHGNMLPEVLTRGAEGAGNAIVEPLAKATATVSNVVLPKLGGAVAKTFEELSAKVATETKKASDIIEASDWGIDEKMAAFAKLGQKLEKMGEVGAYAANQLRDAIKKAADDSATKALQAITDDVTLSLTGQLAKIEEMGPAYSKFGKFGVDAVKTISDAAKKLQADVQQDIGAADWGLDKKIAAFADLRASMERTGNTGVAAMKGLDDSIKSAVTAGATEKLDGIMNSLVFTLNEQIGAVHTMQDEWLIYGKYGVDASKAILADAQKLNAAFGDRQIAAIMDNETLSMEDQLAHLLQLAAYWRSMGANGAQALADLQPKIAALGTALTLDSDILYNVEARLEDNIRAWGGWGKQAGRFVTEFSNLASDSLATLFMTGKFDLQAFGSAFKQIIAKIAADWVVSMVSMTIKSIFFGQATAVAGVTAAAGLNTATVSATLLDFALSPIFLTCVAIAAIFGVLYLAGVDLGDIFGFIAKILGGVLKTALDVILGVVSAIAAVFSALNSILQAFVGWIGSIGDALGKGDLKDLLKIFSGGGIFGGIISGIGSIFGGLFGGLFAEGGKVPGEGPVPIMAHGGEFVMTADASRKFAPLLEAMNTGHLPFKAFAEGGDMMLTRPTMLLGGEAGPELASFRSSGGGAGQGGVVINGPVISSDLTMGQFARHLATRMEAEQRRKRGR